MSSAVIPWTTLSREPIVTSSPTAIDDLVIDGKKVERVSEYKYLGTTIDNKLNFETNTNIIHKKCQSRVYCLQKLRSLNVNHQVLKNFYRCFIESILTFGFLCWFGGLNVKNRNVLGEKGKSHHQGCFTCFSSSHDCDARVERNV
jgi:hypothetical protein